MSLTVLFPPHPPLPLFLWEVNFYSASVPFDVQHQTVLACARFQNNCSNCSFYFCTENISVWVFTNIFYHNHTWLLILTESTFLPCFPSQPQLNASTVITPDIEVNKYLSLLWNHWAFNIFKVLGSDNSYLIF